MINYFQNFPTVVDNRSGNILRNIILSVEIPPEIIKNQSLFYPYIIKDGETPTVVSYNYYGDIGYVWLIAIANKMFDFNSQWPKSTDDFNSYIIDKYGSQANAMSQISYYVNSSDSTYPHVTLDSYNAFSTQKKSLFSAVSIFQDELNQNEAKRFIQLIDNRLASKIAFEMNTLLNK